MAQRCKNIVNGQPCGRTTNDPSGICVICMKFIDMNEELQRIAPKHEKSAMTVDIGRKRKEDLMGNANKKCPKCGTEATSNRAESCKCGHGFEFKKPLKNVAIKEKTCIGCNLIFKPTSPAQKRCPACKEIKIKKIRAGGPRTTIKQPKKTKVVMPFASVKEPAIIEQLLNKKGGLELDIKAIDLTIETIRKYSAA